jgi:hypothetical protein
MGLFSAPTPPPMPSLTRQDFASAAASLPKRAGWSAPELKYLDEKIAARDSVLAVATVRRQNGTSRGALVLTDIRVISALGNRDKRGNPTSEPPVVQTFEVHEIDTVVARPFLKTDMEVTIQMKNGDWYRDLLIGPSAEHASRFVAAVNQAVTNAKLA